MFAEKLKNKLEAMAKEAEKFIKIVPENIEQERLNICQSCEHFFKLTTQCKKCGCFVKAKTKLAGGSCPIKKWDVYKEDV